MEQNKKLSLRDEVKKDAELIEQEFENNQELEDIIVSTGAKDALWAKIQAYEKERVERSDNANNNVELSEELVPNFSERTNDNSKILLSEEDKEALRLGRELMKQKKEETLYEVNTEIHKHLNTEDDKAGHKGKGARVFRMPKKKRVFFTFAAVLVLVVGTSVTSVGSKSYLKELWDRVRGGETMQVVNVKDMDTKVSEDDDFGVFSEIREKLGVTAVRLRYKPTDMRLKSYEIDEEQGRAVLLYEYEGEVICYTIYLNDSDSSLSQKQEDYLSDEFVVEIDEQSIIVKEFSLDNSTQLRYVADFKFKGINYQVKGVMIREEFKKIIENLVYF